MLPAEMAHIADRTRAREEEEDGEEDPPCTTRNNIAPRKLMEDNPPVIPREEDENAEDYAYRLMQAVTSEQVRSFQEMVEAMREISESAKRHRSDESGDTDESNYQDATDRIKIKRIRKRVQAPSLKEL